jgi:hypothetical protein
MTKTFATAMIFAFATAVVAPAHAEFAAATGAYADLAGLQMLDKHGKGSGCDTPHDIAEHPRCRK